MHNCWLSKTESKHVSKIKYSFIEKLFLNLVLSKISFINLSKLSIFCDIFPIIQAGLLISIIKWKCKRKVKEVKGIAIAVVDCDYELCQMMEMRIYDLKLTV